MSHNGLAGTCGEYVVAQSYNAARRYLKFEIGASCIGGHTCQLALTTGHHIYDFGGIFIGDIDCQQLDRLALASVYFLDNHLRLAYLQFVTFATHGLDKY